jgi:hypothetical protein
VETLVKRITTWIAAAALLLSCGAGSTVKKPTDEAFVRAFLETWLVERDLDRARGYLAPDFFVHPALRSAIPDGDHALQFAWNCPNAPSSCKSLDDCIRGLALETITVDAARIKAMPELRSREGRELVKVDFYVKGCNLGAFALIDKDAADNRRVLTIFFLAG